MRKKELRQGIKEIQHTVSDTILTFDVICNVLNLHEGARSLMLDRLEQISNELFRLNRSTH